MSDQYQLVYASEMKAIKNVSSINFEISRILIHSKRHNSQNHINGALYCTNGYFLQILEGEKDTVLTLFNKIKADSRHFNVRVLREGAISHPQFSQWSMHLVSETLNIRRMLADYRVSEFIPYQLNEQVLDQLVHVLSNDGLYDKPMYALPEIEKKRFFSGIKKKRTTKKAA